MKGERDCSYVSIMFTQNPANRPREMPVGIGIAYVRLVFVALTPPTTEVVGFRLHRVSPPNPTSRGPYHTSL